MQRLNQTESSIFIHCGLGGICSLANYSVAHEETQSNRGRESSIFIHCGLGGIYSLANYSVAYEETQSNRVSDCRDFVCSLFPNGNRAFFDFYFTLPVAGVVPCGSHKTSPHTSS